MIGSCRTTGHAGPGATAAGPSVFIVAEDEAVRDSLAALLDCHGLPTRSFSSLAMLRVPGALKYCRCLVVDDQQDGLAIAQILERLVSYAQDIRIALLSSSPAEACPGVAVLEKPVLAHGLIRFITRTL
jgi:FixJ family two-component response regulator